MHTVMSCCYSPVELDKEAHNRLTEREQIEKHFSFSRHSRSAHLIHP